MSNKMKGALGSSSTGGGVPKKVGFKLFPEGEEKKSEDAIEDKQISSSLRVIDGMLSSQQQAGSLLVSPASGSSSMETPTNASSLKQTSTFSTTCSPASSTASTPPTNNNNNPATSLLGNRTENDTTSATTSHNKKNSSSTFRKRFRLPKYFRNRKRSSSNTTTTNGSVGSQGDHSEDEELAQAAAAAHSDDPVMAVFQSRYKNRVRWSLEDQPVAEKYSPEKKDETSSTVNDNNKIMETTGGALDTALAPSSSSASAFGTSTPRSSNSSSSINIKKFVTGALFGGTAGSNKAASDKEFQNEVAKEVEAEKDLIWESNHDSADGGCGEVLYTSQKIKSTTNSSSSSNSQQPEEPQLTFSFTENPKTRAAVLKLIKKGRRAQSIYYRYDYAVKYFVKALEMLTEAKYPDQHPTVRKTLDSLNEAHHKLSSFNNSANIVKIGIKYEDSGELARALKMYSIAYRIRRDNLSRTHPSLVVLLNMLGSIQTKRGEYEEAMQIYELALKDPPKDPSNMEYPETPASTPTAAAEASTSDDRPSIPASQSDHEHFSLSGNLLAKSVTYREMGTIFEKWDRRDEALKMYHLSLDCVAEWKSAAGVSSAEKGLGLLNLNDDSKNNSMSTSDDADNCQGSMFVDKVRVKKSYAYEGDNDDDQTMEKGEMEMLVGLDIPDSENADVNSFSGSICYYDSFFPPHLETINAQKGRSTATAAAMASGDSEGIDRRDDYADIDVALTIHQIAQLFRKQGQFNKALEAYAVALRGMKYSLGNYHPNVAAILGNFGNLQKEMGDLNAAYDTYQEVLGIESYRLGLSHPDVAITLHNIATIDAARGNHQRALKLYEQVMCLQLKLFGREHISIAVTAACMGDVYEAVGQMKDAFESYEDSLRIKSVVQGHHSLEVARILHKLAKIALKRGDHRLASSYVSRALFVYRLNKVPDDHAWVVDAHRDSADIDASLALTKKMTFEC